MINYKYSNYNTLLNWLLINFQLVVGDENLKGSVRFIPPSSIETRPKVLPLVEGIMYPTANVKLTNEILKKLILFRAFL